MHRVGWRTVKRRRVGASKKSEMVSIFVLLKLNRADIFIFEKPLKNIV